VRNPLKLGTAKAREWARPPERADELGDVEVEDLEGNELRIGELWRERPAVLVFLRHYGCLYCREHAVQLDREREEFEAAGVDLAVIGQGRPEHAQDFQRAQKVSLPIYVDRERRAYAAAGTKRATLNELLAPRIVADGIRRGLKSGVRQGRVIGNAAQLGGVLIVKPDGTVPYAHLADDAGDNAPNAEVLEAARAAAGS
jgi:peroxiredoxin